MGATNKTSDPVEKSSAQRPEEGAPHGEGNVERRGSSISPGNEQLWSGRSAPGIWGRSPGCAEGELYDADQSRFPKIGIATSTLQDCGED